MPHCKCKSKHRSSDRCKHQDCNNCIPSYDCCQYPVEPIGNTGPTGNAGPTGATGATGATGRSAVLEFGAFFGMPAGLGNVGANDYPATFAISAGPAPSVAAGSAINFPRLSAVPVGVTINDPGASQANNTEFILPSAGVYRVTWHATFAEPAQLSLFINTTPVIGGGGNFVPVQAASGTPGTVGRAVGETQVNGDVVFQNIVPGAVIQVRNYASASAITMTPLPGGAQAQAATLIIQRLA